MYFYLLPLNRLKRKTPICVGAFKRADVGLSG